MKIRIILLSILLLTTFSYAAERGKGMGQHAMPGKMESKNMQPNDIQWSAAPPVLPSGAEIAVLQGDPFKKGAYTFRLKLPAEYRVPPHSHPGDETITVISGSFRMGMGKTVDESKLEAFPAGSFITFPAGHTHFVIGQEETVIQLSGMGPFGMTYVNPADDPRKKSASAQ